jgi:RNA-directed DNA polymerase
MALAGESPTSTAGSTTRQAGGWNVRLANVPERSTAIRSSRTLPASFWHSDPSRSPFRLVHFLKSSGISRDILNLGHGAAGQGALISQYENVLKKYQHKPMAHPIIILCDNDNGLKSVIKNAKSKIGKTVSTTTTDPFYHVRHNLYLVKVPEGAPPVDKDIESLFDPALLKTVLDGKAINPKKEHADHTEYGKVIFAEAVVRANAGTVDFSRFEGLLTRIEEVLKHYAALLVAAAIPAAAVSTPVAAAGP